METKLIEHVCGSPILRTPIPQLPIAMAASFTPSYEQSKSIRDILSLSQGGSLGEKDDITRLVTDSDSRFRNEWYFTVAISEVVEARSGSGHGAIKLDLSEYNKTKCDRR